MPFFVFFIVIPLIELAVFASVSEHIGIWTTLLFALLTAIIGGSIVKYQGLQTLFSMRESMDRGQMPVQEIFDGFCLIAAGALLITPGFVTDTIGFLLLIPHIRKIVRHSLQTHFKWTSVSGADTTQKDFRQDGIIEGEYERINEDEKDL